MRTEQLAPHFVKLPSEIQSKIFATMHNNHLNDVMMYYTLILYHASRKINAIFRGVFSRVQVQVLILLIKI